MSKFMASSNSSLNGVKEHNLLTEDVLLKIFSYLNEKDLYNVQQVCQTWKKCSQDPLLWKNIKLQKLRSTSDVNNALKKIWMFDRLKKIYIKDAIESSVLLRQIYRCLPNLQYLVMRYCNNLSSHTVKVALRKCTLLKMLDLKGTTFSGGSVFEELPRLYNLQILNLSDNENLTSKDIIDVSLNCRNLEELYVSFIPSSDATKKSLTDEDCSFIVSNMSKDMKGFFIDGATLTDQCFKNILLCSKLERLGFYRAFNFDGKIFSVIWKYLTFLRTLKFTFGNQINNKDVQKLFVEGKDVMNNLEIIDLTGCWKIGDSAIEAIADCCFKLKKLVLKNCKTITDISCLKKCEKLLVLNIAFCPRLSIVPWLPVQSSLDTIFIDNGENLRILLASLRETNDKLQIRICLSQFEKGHKKFKIDKKIHSLKSRKSLDNL